MYVLIGKSGEFERISRFIGGSDKYNFHGVRYQYIIDQADHGADGMQPVEWRHYL